MGGIERMVPWRHGYRDQDGRFHPCLRFALPDGWLSDREGAVTVVDDESDLELTLSPTSFLATDPDDAARVFVGLTAMPERSIEGFFDAYKAAAAEPHDDLWGLSFAPTKEVRRGGSDAHEFRLYAQKARTHAAIVLLSAHMVWRTAPVLPLGISLWLLADTRRRHDAPALFRSLLGHMRLGGAVAARAEVEAA